MMLHLRWDEPEAVILLLLRQLGDLRLDFLEVLLKRCVQLYPQVIRKECALVGEDRLLLLFLFFLFLFGLIELQVVVVHGGVVEVRM
mmetsp:Transcript_28555/g.27522  ORF Transcript_28555/g.27522 Transcript_28555/m.27522 type:complete len:87 (-) Transcript_28555:264-524(-)